METTVTLETLPQRSRFELRDYQEAAIQAIDAAEARGVRRQLVALPTGTGKTVIFAEKIRRRGGRALVLAHRDELIQQAVEKLKMAGLIDVGVVKAERDETDRMVTVASVQTLSRPNRLAQIGRPYGSVVVDEAHHATADTYRRVLDHVVDPDGLLLGVTATAERADGAALGSVFQEIVYEAPLLDMIRQGYLSDLRAVQIKLKANFHELHTRAGDFVASETEEMLLEANAPALVAEAYQQHAAGRKALLFTPTVRAAYEMAKAIADRGIAAEAVDGETPLEQRRDLLRQFHDGRIQVLVNCGVLTEGYDEPSVACIIVARPTKSRPLYVQMIGRGTRRYPGKDDCLVLDVVGATTRYDLMTTATLFGIDPDELTKDPSKSVTGIVAEQEAKVAAHGEMVAKTVALFGERPLHWVSAGGNRFVLSIGEHGMLILQAQDDTRWSVLRRSRERHGAAERLHRDLDLGYAQGAAEDYARQLGAGALVDREAPWRQHPASEKQIAMLIRCRVSHPPDITKGDAADLLTAHFARSRAW